MQRFILFVIPCKNGENFKKEIPSPLVSDPHTNLCFILPRFHIRILTECYLRDGCEVKAQGTFTKSTTAFNSFAHFPDFKVLILAHGIFL